MDQKCVLPITTALLLLPLVSLLCNDPKCVVCNNRGSNCEDCEKGFTVNGSICSPCPTNCLTCTADGYCQSCSPGFWGHKCLYNCPDNCNEAGCDNISGYCLNCDLGWYRPHCQQECNRCENEKCNLRNCSTGFKDKYVQEIYNGISYCIPCSLFCKNCSTPSLCNQCYSGHYIYQYMFEDKIVSTCLNCSSREPKCVDCTFDRNQVLCKNCEAGYVVDQDRYKCVTTVPCTHCQNGCDSQGLCFGGCRPGWTGSRCDHYACSNSCETCINQDACLSCKDGFYTQMCNVPCNKNCQSGNYPRCRFVDGYCSNGFWGEQCEYNCNDNCLTNTTTPELCHRNGTCYYGCKSGYMGSDCSLVSSFSTSLVSLSLTTRASTAKRTTSLKRTKPDENTPEANVQTDFRGSLGPAIGGSIAGGYVWGILTAVVKDKDRTQSKNTYYNVSMAASHEERTKPDTDRQPDRKDTDLESASRQSEATLYEKLSERNKGNVYDHLEQPSENEYRQTIIEFGSNVEYYNH